MARPKRKLILTEKPVEEELNEPKPIIKSAKVEKAKKEAADEEQVERVEDVDESIRTGIPLRPFYQCVKLAGEGRFRVVGKVGNGNWITPVLNEPEAQKLAIALNRKDPEQREERRRTGGRVGVGGVVASGWTEEQTSKIVNPIVVKRER